MAMSWNDKKRKKSAQQRSKEAKRAIAILKDIDLGNLKPKKKVKPW